MEVPGRSAAEATDEQFDQPPSQESKFRCPHNGRVKEPPPIVVQTRCVQFKQRSGPLKSVG